MKIFSCSLLLLTLLPFGAHAETYKVKASDSHAHWEGRKIVGAHNGELAIKSGQLQFEKEMLKSGSVEIDMTSLKDMDLTDAAMNAKLVNHLKSDDFFSVEKHPVSVLKVTKAAKQKDGSLLVTGDLTIKGITHTISFPAQVKKEKGVVKATAEMSVDRTAYDIKFRSAKFFSDLGDKVIYDDFKVKVDLTASK